jgi:hypothetical protein
MRRRPLGCELRGKQLARRGLGEREGVSRPVKRTPAVLSHRSFPTPRTVRRQRRVAHAPAQLANRPPQHAGLTDTREAACQLSTRRTRHRIANHLLPRQLAGLAALC